MIKCNRLLYTIDQDLDSTQQKTARDNINAQVNLLIADDTPINISKTSNIGNLLTLNSRKFSTSSPVLTTDNVLSIDDSLIVTSADLESKQKKLISGSNTTVADTSISAVDTSYSVSAGLTLTSSSENSDDHKVNMSVATNSELGGVLVNDSSYPIKMTDSKISIDPAENISVGINTTDNIEPYYASSEAGYQPKVVKDGNAYTISSAIHWNSASDDTSDVVPLTRFYSSGSHVGLNTTVEKSKATIGSDVNPIILSNGALTALTKGSKESSWGSGEARYPLKLVTGRMKHWTDDIGNEDTISYLSNGKLTPSTESVGKIESPIYFNSTKFQEVEHSVYHVEYNGTNNGSSSQYGYYGFIPTKTIQQNILTMLKAGMKNLYISITTSPKDTETSGEPTTLNAISVPICVDAMIIGSVYTIGLAIGGNFSSNQFPAIKFYTTQPLTTGNIGYIYMYGFVKGYLKTTYVSVYDSSTSETTITSATKEESWDSPFFANYEPSVNPDVIWAPFASIEPNATSTNDWSITGTKSTSTSQISSTLTQTTTTQKIYYNGLSASSTANLYLPIKSMTSTPSSNGSLRYIKFMRGEDYNESPTLIMMDWG